MQIYSQINANRTYFSGLSSDTKPTVTVQPGAIFIETDTNDKYIYTSSGTWVLYFDKTGLLDSSGNGINSSDGVLFTAAYIWQPSSLSYIHASADASGSLNVTAAGASAVVNVASFGGNAVVTGTGTSGLGIPRVTVSNDSNILATQSGTWTIANTSFASTQSGTWTVGLSAGTNAIGSITNTSFASTQSGTWVVNTKNALTANSPAAASVGLTSAQVLASNASRKGLTLTNTSTANISLGFGSAAVLNSGITLYPGGVFYMDEYCFSTQAVNAIASVAASNLGIQEWQ
jgi:hypothetical protein